MLTFQDLYTRVTSLFNETNATTTALAKQFVNESYKTAIVDGNIEDEGVYFRRTTEEQDTYELPSNIRKLSTLKVIETNTNGTADGTTANKIIDSTASFGSDLVGEYIANNTDNTFSKITAVDSSTQLAIEEDIFVSGEDYSIGDGQHYLSSPVTSEEKWNWLKSSQTDTTSNVLTNHYIRNSTFQIFPRPSVSNYILVMTYTKVVGDMSKDDYSDGTIELIKGLNLAVGTTTTFTAGMVGRYIKTGSDGIWYRVKSFTSSTVLVLEKPFQEESAFSASYTIGEIPLVAEHLQDSLTYKAIAFLYRKREELSMAREYDGLWKEARREIKYFGASKDEKITCDLKGSKREYVDFQKDQLITKS